MPFKLLKKSRHYNVVSKSLFVISVEILDGTNVECTLSSESTGQDCLEVVCQKLGLNQLKFFGLQYISCHSDGSFCWLELDKPMKRQLDKHARGLSVYLRVMYYVISGVRLITDEVTRYHYFLQLKQDIIEGKLSCTPQQASELASYSMQAEFGNFDAERHTALYLKEFQLFPKTFNDPIMLESLTEAASRQHAALHNLPQSTAEEYYICACQKLDGYGEEEYHVKDKEGNAVVISIGLTGVSVSYTDRPSRRYGWSDISNVINHKKEFLIESVGGIEKADFLFGDVDSAKNAWRFCVLQHIFFRQFELNGENEGGVLRELPEPPGFQQAHEDLREMDSCEDLTRYPTSSQWDLKVTSTQNLSQRAQSTSCLDLHSTSVTTNDRENLRNLLPSYRPAPDYETAVQQKYNSTNHLQVYSSHPEIHYPDITRNTMGPLGQTPPPFIAQQQIWLCKQPPPPSYPPIRICSNSTPDLAVGGINHHHHHMNQLITGSSPDLVSGDQKISLLRVAHHHYNTAGEGAEYRRPQYLPAMLPPPPPPNAVIIENPNITKHIKKVLDEHGNIIYCMPANMKEILQRQQQEPIYENIPRAWGRGRELEGQQEELEMRSRAQSIHSAPPEISQVVNHSLVNALQAQLTISPPPEPTRENMYANIVMNPPTPSPNILESPSHHLQMKVRSSTPPPPPPQQIQESPLSQLKLNTSSTTNNSNSSLNTTSSSNKSKKRRWGILMGRGKSEEKIKSATLKPDKKKEAGGGTRSHPHHRWSTGQPKFNPLPPSITKEAMCQLLENKLGDSQLFFEFEKIPKKKENGDFSTALLPENAPFNRFKDVLPYEENRIRLTPTKGNKYGYINASHITATVGSKQRFYIAAQGPTRATLLYFWQCVWEAEVYLMVQLTDHTEDLIYLPDADERSVNVGKEYQVWWEFSQKTGHCITSKIRLCQTASRRYRTMWHLHYTEWGDRGGCPTTTPHFLGFLEEMQSVFQHSMTEIPPGHNKNPPILVHCTAGVGRTGLTILSDLLLYTVDHNQEVCIPGVVALLRQQRPQMVQTIAQYRFVYSLLIHYLKQTRLI